MTQITMTKDNDRNGRIDVFIDGTLFMQAYPRKNDYRVFVREEFKKIASSAGMIKNPNYGVKQGEAYSHMGYVKKYEDHTAEEVFQKLCTSMISTIGTATA